MIVLDIETTGVDPHKHAIIDIAAMDFNNPSYTFHRSVLVDSTAEVQKEALEYNGFTIEEITDASRPTLKSVLTELGEWMKPIKNRIMAGQNPDFDINFLKYNISKENLDISIDYHMIDQHSITYYKLIKLNKEIPLNDKGGSGITSDFIMKFVGIPPEPKPHHSALNGVIWEAESFSRLMYGRNLLPQFAQYDIPEYLK